jgi:hypothetical protein
MDPSNQKMIENVKSDFLLYLNTYKTIECPEWLRYKDMNISDLINELDKDIYKFKIAPTTYINVVCEKMGMDYDTHYDKLEGFFLLFSDLIDIIYM